MSSVIKVILLIKFLFCSNNSRSKQPPNGVCSPEPGPAIINNYGFLYNAVPFFKGLVD